MELARRASRAPSIFTSSAPSAASGAEPVTRTELPVPALIVASIEVRPPASRPEPATSSGRQAGVAHLRRDHTLQTHAPFAGRIAGRSADRRIAVGDAG